MPGVLFLVAVLFLSSCAPRVSYPPVYREGIPYRERGIASWYGDEFHGRKTANGETYDMYAMTAAHRTLPFHSRVRVTNLDNGKAAD
ncbi:MAG TPA: septal ring lytic transglycosylase RlpA family protein, partial [Thermodesulfobacteriota bacterium]|nr:septal ring lytic transglycosylase RlpA family protein [Thermodesulfobacteriota bacterium]